MVAAGWVLYLRLPTSFLPNEGPGHDAGGGVQLPPGATQERTRAVMEQVEGFMLKQPEVEGMVGVLGFSFSGQGQNAALAFVTLGLERAPRAWRLGTGPGGPAPWALCQHPRRLHLPVEPAADPELGSASGFTFRLQDRGGVGRDTLLAARNQLLGMASQTKSADRAVRPDGLEDAPQLQLDVDRDKGRRSAWAIDAINAARLHRAGLELHQRLPRMPAGCSASSCRPTRRRACSRRPAQVACDATARARRCRCRGLRQHALGHRRDADRALQRLSGMRISGSAAPGQHRRRDGRMEQLAAQLPAEGWASSGPASRARKSRSPARRPSSSMASRSWRSSCALAALYESWSIPLAVILVVPLGVLGVLLATAARHTPTTCLLPGRPDHHHRPVSQERDPDHRVRQGPAGAGQDLLEAALEAAHLRCARSS